MDKKIHGVINTKPEKRHLLKEVGNLVVNEFGEAVSLLEYTTIGFWLWKRVVLEFEVIENAHYLYNESVEAISNAIMDRDGDIHVSAYDISYVTKHNDTGCKCNCGRCEMAPQLLDDEEPEEADSDEEEHECVQGKTADDTEVTESEEEATDSKENGETDEELEGEEEFAGYHNPSFYESP